MGRHRGAGLGGGHASASRRSTSCSSKWRLRIEHGVILLGDDRPDVIVRRPAARTLRSPDRRDMPDFARREASCAAHEPPSALDRRDRDASRAASRIHGADLATGERGSALAGAGPRRDNEVTNSTSKEAKDKSDGPRRKAASYR